MKLAIFCLVALLCLSQVYSQAPRVNTAALEAETNAERAIASRKPVVAPAPSFALRERGSNGRYIRRPAEPTITPEEEAAANRQIKYDRKAEQRAEEPTNQANSRQRQINEAAQELKGKNKQQIAAQVVDLKKAMADRQDRINQLQNVIKARDPKVIIPNEGVNAGALAAGRVKMNLFSKMNQAEKLKAEMGSKWDSLVSEQAADIQKLKDLAKFTESNSANNLLYVSGGYYSAEPRYGYSLQAASKESFNTIVVNYARAIQERENARMQALVSNNQVQKVYLDDKMKALQTVTNNPNSPLGNEANLDEAEEYDSVEQEPATPREAFHNRRHGKVSVDVQVEV